MIDYFVNREAEFKLIDDAFAVLREEKHLLRTPIIDFYGVEGISKTSLLRRVEQCCHGDVGTRYNSLVRLLLQDAQSFADETRSEQHSDMKPAEAELLYAEEAPGASPNVFPSSTYKETPQPVELTSQLKANVLLVTATEIEAQEVLNLFPGYTKWYGRWSTYYHLGIVGGARVVMVQSEMGSSGPGGSSLTVFEAIRALSPTAVVLVGIAFGLDSTRQRIGDIVVSRHIVTYQQQRKGIDPYGRPLTVLRGERSFASIRLLDRFRSGVKDWQGPKVEFGPILSGESLIDNPEVHDRLREFEPEAIAGEMEGAGVYTATSYFKVDWLVAKAVSDFADGNKSSNKDENQRVAACNIAQFVLHVLQQGGFIDA